MRKIGLFGGTFNPIHIGHAILAERVYAAFGLDELVFIPSKLPPHKSNINTPASERYEMVRMAAETLGKGFSVSDYEMKLEGISYTYRTVSHWRQEHPDDALFFITGSDIFITIDTWQHWQDLFGICNFIVVNRTGTDFTSMLKRLPPTLIPRVVPFSRYANERAGKIILFNMPPVDVSSTEIRDKNTGWREMLMGDIRRYIDNKGLY